MKAIVQERFGPPEVLEFRDVDVPAVKSDQVLVRVRAASVNALDWYQVTGTPYVARLDMGLFRPKQTIPGVDLAGQVEAVGPDVVRLRPGDEVFGTGPGAFAEYACVREARLVRKPASVSFAQAAAVPVAALTGLQGLRDKAETKRGQRVLIIGASGGVGTFAVQIAKWLGAHVTGVCSTRNVDLVRSLGADRVIDYTREDFVHSGQRYDVIFDVAGNRSVADRKRALAHGGILVVVGGPKHSRLLGPASALLKVFLAAPFSGHKLVGFISKNSPEDLDLLRELLESGAIVPAIERTYPLVEAPRAIRHVGQEHPRSKVVIQL